MKSRQIFFIFSLCVLLSLFVFDLNAEENEPSINLSHTIELFHNIEVDKDFSFQFLDPNNSFSQQTTSVPLSLEGEQFFSSFVLKFNFDMSFDSISLGFGYLMNEEGADDQGSVQCLPYRLTVYKANSRVDSDKLGTINATNLQVAAPGSGSYLFAGTVNIINGRTTFIHQGIQLLETRRLADLVISLDDEQARAGSYSAYIVCSFTSGE